MADERAYEQRVTNALVVSLRTNQDASNFIHAAQKQSELTGCICGRMARLVWMSVDEAKTYINFATGKFKGGRYMPHCLDPELKRLFAELEAVTKEINKYPFHTATEAVNVSNAKKDKLKQIVDEVKRFFSEAKAREIVTRAKAEAIRITGIKF